MFVESEYLRSRSKFISLHKMCHCCLPYHLPCVFLSPKKTPELCWSTILADGYPLEVQAYGWPSLKHPRSDEAGSIFAQPYGGLHCLELSPQFEPVACIDA